MEYRKLGNSGLKVSVIGLGGNAFGWKIDEQASAKVIDYALDSGVNFIDTADMYDNGRSEQFIGSALKGKRSKVIITTKFGSAHGVKMVFPMGSGPNIRGGSRHYIEEAVNASLRRLHTDYIDLYQMHDPDPDTPIEETLRALDDVIKAGKVLYIGCCDFATWQLCDALWTSRINHLAPFITIQTRYNLLDRRIELELAGYCQAYGIGLIPWGPLVGGFLTGKYHTAVRKPSDSLRMARDKLIMEIYGDILTEANYNKVARLMEFAAGRGHTVGELALAWLLSKPWVNTVSASATTQEQLSANIIAQEWKLSAKEIAEVEAISCLEK